MVNQYIRKYNAISSEKLQEIDEILSYNLFENFNQNINSKQHSLQEDYNIAQGILNQLITLRQDYFEYEKYLKVYDNAEKLKKSWSIILENTKIKAQKTKEYNKLLYDIYTNQEVLKKIKKIYNQGPNWVNKYSEYQTANLWITKAANNRNELLNSLDSWVRQKTIIELSITSYNQKIFALDNIKTNLQEASNKIVGINLQLENKEKRKIKLDRLEEKVLSNIIRVESDLGEIAELYYSINNTIPSLKILKVEVDNKIKNQFISDFENLTNNIKNLERKVLVSRTSYEELQKLTTELDFIVNKGREYILNTKLKSCPLCKKEYDSMEELVNCTNMNQSDNIQKHLNDWNKYKNDLNIENEKLKLLIEEWNLYIDTIKQQKTILLNKIRKKIDRINRIKTKILMQMEKRNINLSALIDIFHKNGFDEPLYTKEYIEKWINKRKKYFEEQISTQKISLTECENYISKINQDIVIFENEYAKIKTTKENFETVDNNELVSYLNEFKIALDWAKICEQYVLNQKKMQNFDQNIGDLKKVIEGYNWVNIDKEEYYQQNVKTCEEIIQAKNNELQKYIIRFTSVFGHKNISLSIINNKYKKIQQKMNIIKSKTQAIIDITSQIVLLDYANKMKKLTDEMNKLKQQENVYKKVLLKTTDLFNEAKLKIESKVTGIFNEVLTNDIFKRIEPHPFMKKLKYEVSFNEAEKPELSIYVANDSELDKYLPEWYFSSAQLNVVALSTFLGRALSLTKVPINTIFIDDPIGHFDDINLIAFVDLLRTLVEFKRCQIIISTHDENMFNLIRRKIPPNYYKSKFIQFKSVGVIG